MGKLATKQKHSEQQPYAKPVLKWAGGKSQLLPILANHYPQSLGSKTRKYIEPFFGGGAVFFELYNAGLVDEAVLLDSNPELITLYNTIKEKPADLVAELQKLEKKYLALDDSSRQEYFYEVRESFNRGYSSSYTSPKPARAAQLIFLNRTCFNGLFRVNKKQEYNVPHGRYSNPRILDDDNIYAVSEALQIAEIIQSDFTDIAPFVSDNTFIYYDPPYRPLNKTSNFTAYSGDFDDAHQMQLAGLFKQLDKKNVYQMLSNSDPLSATGDRFFDELYSGYSIHRIEARRLINADSSKRGKISEILVKNYEQN
ncbi:MAG: DNA adenine methylase [Alphaproteobacteria bacterium]|nr:DNA adenine methylase [Alphaproteobacteria bacterium]